MLGHVKPCYALLGVVRPGDVWLGHFKPG